MSLFHYPELLLPMQKLDSVQKFSAAEFATAATIRLSLLMAKAPLVFPETMEYVNVRPASGSEAACSNGSNIGSVG